ncbi:MAG: ABC-F family ATP-binding cassette domain-containing protein [Bacteroidales bacterium]|nr:ABC-F family ATP-binding cassette domain-containing protein [Bacteroidales bacterium]
MNYLSVDGISKSYGIKVLFDQVTFGIEKGDKTALIATNGSGKSTLLKILVGKESPDTGSITYANDIKVGYLEQLPVYPKGTHVSDLIADLNDEQQLKARQYLTRFSLNNLEQSVDELSGGQVKRLALALVLLHEPDFLILDEPTNHLDVEMVEWLERYLSQSSVTLLMVTHDRYFLDRVCNKIFELYQGVMYTHNGNFDYYVEKSREREEVKRATAEKAASQLRRELEWIRSTPQARTGKSKSRIDAFYDLKEKAKYQEADDKLQFGLQAQRLGGKILEMYNVTKTYDDITVLRDFDYVFKRGERIGLIGPNGVGKSSFLNLITQQVAPDHGRIIVGDTVTYGYYRQEGIQFDENKTVIDAIRDIADVLHYGKDQVYTADQLLAHFMFPYKMQRQPIALLSGGEKRRLYLLTVLVSNPNFLILDEPTNDLDLLTLQKLEDFLKAYKGCLLVVSHDRYFMDEVVDQLFVFQGDGKVKGFMGNYSQYKEYLREKEQQERKVQAVQKREEQPKTVREKTKRSFKEEREFQQLTTDIAALEAEKEQIHQEMANISDYQKLQELGKRLQEIKDLLDEKEMRWLELDEWS